MPALIRVRPSEVSFQEHWNVFFERSNNDQYRFDEKRPPGISIESKITLDGRSASPPQGLQDVIEAAANEEAARAGVFGLYLPRQVGDDAVDIDSVIVTAEGSRPPLFSGYADWRTWAIEFDTREFSPPDASKPGAHCPVIACQDEIPLHNKGFFPVDLEARIFAVGVRWDDVRGELERATRADEATAIALVGKAISKLVSAASEHSQFALMLNVAVRFPNQTKPTAGTSARLSHLRLRWALPTDPGELRIFYGHDKRAIGYYSRGSAVEFGGLEAQIGDDAFYFAPIRIDIGSAAVLREMPALEGVATIEVDGLLSGLQAYASDWRGELLNTAVRSHTKIVVRFNLVLQDLYQQQLYTTHHRIQLSGVDMDETRLDIIRMILREARFAIQPDLPAYKGSDNVEYRLFHAQRQESGEQLDVVLLIATERREVMLEQGDHKTKVSGRARGADTVIDVRGFLPGSPIYLNTAINDLQKNLRVRLNSFKVRR